MNVIGCAGVGDQSIMRKAFFLDEIDTSLDPAETAWVGKLSENQDFSRDRAISLLVDHNMGDPAHACHQEFLRTSIGEALRTLSFYHRRVIELRYGINEAYSYTFDEIARVLRISRGRACGIRTWSETICHRFVRNRTRSTR